MLANFINSLSKRMRLGLLIASGVILTAAGFFTGFGIGRNTVNKEANDPDSNPGEILNVGSIGEQAVLPTTAVEWVYHFSDCGHNVDFDGKESVVGLTKEDIEKKIDGASVVSLTAENAKIQIDVDSYCPEHYLLVMVEQNELAVFRTNPETLKNETVMELDYNTEALDPESVNDLKSGMLFHSLDEIDAYLENAET